MSVCLPSSPSPSPITYTHLSECFSIVFLLCLILPNLLFVQLLSILSEGKVMLKNGQEDLIVAEKACVEEGQSGACLVQGSNKQCLLAVSSLELVETVHHSICLGYQYYSTVHHST